jgi:hypothetical protein
VGAMGKVQVQRHRLGRSVPELGGHGREEAYMTVIHAYTRLSYYMPLLVLKRLEEPPLTLTRLAVQL